MGIDIKNTIEIDRPAPEVFAFISEFENNPRWQKGSKRCEWSSKERRTVGATYVQKASFLGRPIDTHFRVSEFTEGERVSIESTKSTFPLQITRSVASLGPSRCCVTAHVRGQPTGLLRLVPSVMVRKSVAGDYRRLKAMLEASSPAVGTG